MLQMNHKQVYGNDFVIGALCLSSWLINPFWKFHPEKCTGPHISFDGTFSSLAG